MVEIGGSEQSAQRILILKNNKLFIEQLVFLPQPGLDLYSIGYSDYPWLYSRVYISVKLVSTTS